MTVLESVHCPVCSTHYGLKASRVRIGLRRARCFRCSSLFEIEQAVLRLTGGAGQPAEEIAIGPEDLLDLQPLTEETPAQPEVAPLPIEAAPSLTMGDLEGMEDKLLEKTLIVEDEQALLQPAARTTAQDQEAAGGPVEDDFETVGGYSSAKDAIAKLLGNLPAPEAPQERRGTSRTATQMDVEATLDALESTLGGVGSRELGGRPIVAPPETPLPAAEPAKPTFNTLKLTHDEIVSAMKAASTAATVPAAQPTAVAPKPVAPQVQPEADTSLLKLQVGQEVYNNISMEQLTSWIEQGRVQDFHMVARQFSENWIEAGKIPSLRPIFERIRRQQVPAAQQAQAVIVQPAAEAAPARKSLFGGLFNRG